MRASPTAVLHWRAGEDALTELELLRGDLVVRVIPVEDAAVTIGRDLGNGVVLADAHVSAHHAVVHRGPEGPTVRDLGSTNGTFVNGAPVTEVMPLGYGDVVQLGQVRLRLERPRPARARR